jgi:hypothetical protein
MIETVAAGIVLPPDVTPQTVKPNNPTLDFDAEGNLLFFVYIRTLTPIGVDAPASTALMLTTFMSPNLIAFLAGYTLWRRSVEFRTEATVAVSVEIVRGNETVDVLFVGND